MNKPIAVLMLCALAAGCAEHPLERELVVDGSRNAHYNDDFSECMYLARNYDDGTPREGAVVGAAIGGLVAAESVLAGRDPLTPVPA